MNTLLPGLLAIALYLLASFQLAGRLLRTSAAAGCQRRQILLTGFSACFIHGALLYPAIVTASGLNLAFFYAISLVALTTAALLLVSALFEPAENLGLAVFPLAAVSIVLVLLNPSERIITSASSWQLDFHILTSLLAYSILGLAALQSVLLAIQDRKLRNHQTGGIMRGLPPLAVMESLLFQMISTGFALLTLALVAGALFLEDIFAQHLVHKTTLSIIAWLVFAVLLWGRWRFGWRGRTALRWTMGGFIFLMLAYFGSKFVLELILGR
jgi:ABC-type uncharacterized transport system permease subunit